MPFEFRKYDVNDPESVIAALRERTGFLTSVCLSGEVLSDAELASVRQLTADADVCVQKIADRRAAELAAEEAENA